MKKFFAILLSVVFVGILAFSFMAFIDGDSKKQKTETTATTVDSTTASATCKNHDSATSEKSGTKACCNTAAKTASGECPKSATCKQHSETAEK